MLRPLTPETTGRHGHRRPGRRARIAQPGAVGGPRTGYRPLTAPEHLRQRVLRVAEQQGRLRVVEQLVLDTGETGAHRALEEDDLLRLGDLEDRHAVDRRARRGLRRRVHDVVRADDEDHVRGLELGVDLVHLLERLVRHVRLGEQHVHVAGHAAGDRVDAVDDVDAPGLEHLGQLADRVLRLRDREAVAGHDDDLRGVVEQDRDVVRLHRLDRPVGDRGGARGRPALERAEHDAADRAAHRRRPSRG